MSSYRFCRTDDIGLLVDALNRCWLPYFPDEAPMTAAAFKRSIRDLQVWCSSCMVAFAGADPIGVLIGAKRTTGTLIHRIAVHPDHCRQGHARHLLASISSKLAILGPPRIVVEVPEAFTHASELFRACGYVEEATLTDYVLPPGSHDTARVRQDTGAWSRHAGNRESLVIPVTVDDLAANGLLASETDRSVCWSRAAETLAARKEEVGGFAVVSDDRIEAYVLYAQSSVSATELLLLRSFVDDEGARLGELLARIGARAAGGFQFNRVHQAELPALWLQKLGFGPSGRYRLYSARPG